MPLLDKASIRELLVAAANVGGDMKALLDDDSLDGRTRSLAVSILSLYNLVEGIVEKAIMPMCESVSTVGTVGGYAARANKAINAPQTAPKPSGERELREALSRSENESVLFEANLGSSPIYNRAKLSAALSAGIKTAVIAAAKDGDAAEAVRVIDDAFGGVEDVDFLGQATKPFVSNRDANDPRNNTFCTLPVKLRFSAEMPEYILRTICAISVDSEPLSHSPHRSVRR